MIGKVDNLVNWRRQLLLVATNEAAGTGLDIGEAGSLHDASRAWVNTRTEENRGFSHG